MYQFFRSALWVLTLTATLQLLPLTIAFDMAESYVEQPHSRVLREDGVDAAFTLWPVSFLSRLVRPYTALTQHFPSLRNIEEEPLKNDVDLLFEKLWTALEGLPSNPTVGSESESLNLDSAEQYDRLSTVEASPATVLALLSLFSPPEPAAVDEWQTAVVNLEDASTNAKAGFFGSLTPTQQDFVNTLIPANLILSRLGIQGPISQPLISFLRTISPTQLALLRTIFPTEFLNAISQHKNDNVAPTLQQAGKRASDKLRTVGIEAASYEIYENGVKKNIQLASLSATDIYRQLKLELEGAVRLAYFFDQMLFDLMSPTEVAKKIIKSNDLGADAAIKLLSVSIPPQYGMDSKMQELKEAITFYFEGPQHEQVPNRPTSAEKENETDLSSPVPESRAQTEGAAENHDRPAPPLRALGAKRYRRQAKTSFRHGRA